MDLEPGFFWQVVPTGVRINGAEYYLSERMIAIFSTSSTFSIVPDWERAGFFEKLL